MRTLLIVLEVVEMAVLVEHLDYIVEIHIHPQFVVELVLQLGVL
jgi:hypothetical protein